MTQGPVSLAWIARATLTVMAIVSVVWLAWHLSHVLLLLIGAIVVAVILRALRDLIARYTPLPKNWALGIAIVLLALIVAGFVYLLGSQLFGEFQSLRQRLPGIIDNLSTRFGVDIRGELLKAQYSWMSQVANFAPDLIGAIASIVLVVVGGTFLAADPARYRNGALKLLPKSSRPQIGAALDHAGGALRLWLIGKVVMMLVVGVFTTIGLYVIGVPSALALGFMAGILEFIPFVGPILSFVPAAAVALSGGEVSFWWVLGLYLLIQQLENNLLVPLVQQRTVELPPVLGLFAIVATGVLFGPLGVILGVPLTIILMVLVKQLYIRNILEDDPDSPQT